MESLQEKKPRAIVIKAVKNKLKLEKSIRRK